MFLLVFIFSIMPTRKLCKQALQLLSVDANAALLRPINTCAPLSPRGLVTI